MIRNVLRTGLVCGVLAIGLTACDSRSMIMVVTDSPFSPLRIAEQPQSPVIQGINKIYYAPAQTYDLDLSSPAFVGKLKLRANCSPEGNSLTIRDQIGQFYRIDVINVNHNPKFPDAENKDLAALSQQLYQFYLNLYKAYPQNSIKSVVSPLGKSTYASMSLPSHLSPIGFLVSRRENYVYVIQHQQKFLMTKKMQYVLSQIAKSMQVPGRQIKNSGSMLPLGIDLQSPPDQINTWKKAAHCL